VIAREEVCDADHDEAQRHPVAARQAKENSVAVIATTTTVRIRTASDTGSPFTASSSAITTAPGPSTSSTGSSQKI
jgi:hypothetical protein